MTFLPMNLSSFRTLSLQPAPAHPGAGELPRDFSSPLWRELVSRYGHGHPAGRRAARRSRYGR